MTVVHNIVQTLNSSDIDQHVIDEVVNSLEHVFIDSAKTTFGIHSSTNSKKKDSVNDKKWFNEDCKQARKAYHRNRRKYNHAKNESNKAEMLGSAKQYKRVMRENVVKFKRKVRTHIRNLRTSSPRDYWRYINSINDKKKSSNADINVVFDFFKQLNADNNVDDANLTSDFPDVSLENALNNEITFDEIKKAIS